MFVCRISLPAVASAHILLVAWSDHDPILISFSSLIVHPKPAHWRINDFLLTSKGTKELIMSWMLEYFSQNSHSVGSQTVLWEAYKAVIRGQLIELSFRRKKEKRTLMLNQEKALEAAAASFKATPHPPLD